MEAAIDLLRTYAEYGYRLHPLRPNDKRPILRDWPNRATNDWPTIADWVRRWPSANWGLVTGADAHGRPFSVLDIDPDALASAWPWDRQKSQSIRATGCPLSQTPRGGFHIVFRADWPCSAGKVSKGADVRGRGGFIAVAPSIVDGRAYRWIRPLVPAGGLPQAPAWLAEMVAKATRKSESPSPCHCDNSAGLGAEYADHGGVLCEGSRNTGLTKFAGRLRRLGLTEQEIFAALLVANRIRCRPPLPDNEVAGIAKSVSRYPAGSRFGLLNRKAPSARIMSAAWRRGIAYARRRKKGARA